MLLVIVITKVITIFGFWEIGFVSHNLLFLIETFSATKALRHEGIFSHRFRRFTQIDTDFLTLIAQGTQRGFGRQAFFGKAFSPPERCERPLPCPPNSFGLRY